MDGSGLGVVANDVGRPASAKHVGMAVQMGPVVGLGVLDVLAGDSKGGNVGLDVGTRKQSLRLVGTSPSKKLAESDGRRSGRSRRGSSLSGSNGGAGRSLLSGCR